ncbi:MAG: hypothetical protein HYY07_04435 [Elusimicrobia bacterium]|nr:hypothetical protein [Elusimicrobiota bacterium]
MDKIESLDEKIRAVAKLVLHLREQNAKLNQSYKKLQQENELLTHENVQVRKFLNELQHLREERKAIKQKCERLLSKFQKLNL